MDEHLERIRTAVVSGKHDQIENMVKKAIADRVDPQAVINEAMIAAMDIIGRRFAEGEIFVPEMLVSAATMKKGLNIIKPLLKDQESESQGTVIICTVKGDIHDIGKNLVITMLEGAGFKVIDLGVDSDIDEVIQQVADKKPDILGLSALLTTTMPEMQKVIRTLDAKGLRNDIKVMVGGAPLDEGFAKEIGADGYGKDATAAVELARNFKKTSKSETIPWRQA